MEVAGYIGGVMSIGEYEDVAAWLGALVGMCDAHRLF